LALALVCDLRDHRAPVGEEDLADFDTDVLARFVLARASAGLAGSTIRNDTGHLELIRAWFGRRRDREPTRRPALRGPRVRRPGPGGPALVLPRAAGVARPRSAPPAHPAIRAPLPSSSPGTSSYRPRSLGLLAAPTLGHGRGYRVIGGPEERVVAVSWITSRWVYVERRVAGAVARALPDPAGRGLGGGQVKRSRTCVVGAAGSGLWA